jgi:hypothetical protein
MRDDMHTGTDPLERSPTATDIVPISPVINRLLGGESPLTSMIAQALAISMYDGHRPRNRYPISQRPPNPNKAKQKAQRAARRKNRK